MTDDMVSARDLEAMTARALEAERRLEEARATNARLNRRAQEYEAGLREKLAVRTDPRGFGRCLANAAASMEQHRAEAAESRALAAEARIAAVEQECWMPLDMIATTLDAHRVTANADHEAARAAEAEVKRLSTALRGCLAYLWPSSDEGHTGFVDRLGMEFYRETGVWPHFKSAPMETHVGDMEESRKRWTAWLETKRDAAANAARAALKETR